MFSEREIICWIALAGRLWHLQCAAYTLTTVCVCVCVQNRLFLFLPMYASVCTCLWVCAIASPICLCVCVLVPVNQLAVTNHYSCGSKLPLWLMSLRTHCISELSAKMDRPFPQFHFLLFSFFLVVIFLLLTLPPTRCLTLFLSEITVFDEKKLNLIQKAASELLEMARQCRNRFVDVWAPECVCEMAQVLALIISMTLRSA